MDNVLAIEASAATSTKIRFEGDSAESFARFRSVALMWFFIGQVGAVVGKLAELAFLLFVLSLVIDGHLTLGDLAALWVYFGYLRGPAMSLSILWVRLQDNVAAMRRVFAMLDLAKEDDLGDINLPPIRDGIKLSNVGLVYPDGGARWTGSTSKPTSVRSWPLSDRPGPARRALRICTAVSPGERGHDHHRRPPGGHAQARKPARRVTTSSRKRSCSRFDPRQHSLRQTGRIAGRSRAGGAHRRHRFHPVTAGGYDTTLGVQRAVGCRSARSNVQSHVVCCVSHDPDPRRGNVRARPGNRAIPGSIPARSGQGSPRHYHCAPPFDHRARGQDCLHGRWPDSRAGQSQ